MEQQWSVHIIFKFGGSRVLVKVIACSCVEFMFEMQTAHQPAFCQCQYIPELCQSLGKRELDKFDGTVVVKSHSHVSSQVLFFFAIKSSHKIFKSSRDFE